MKTIINYFINTSGIVTEMSRADGFKETWINNKTNTFIYKSKKHIFLINRFFYTKKILRKSFGYNNSMG